MHEGEVPSAFRLLKSWFHALVFPDFACRAKQPGTASGACSRGPNALAVVEDFDVFKAGGLHIGVFVGGIADSEFHAHARY